MRQDLFDHIRRAFALAFAVGAFSHLLHQPVSAQRAGIWPEAAEARLKGIYEQNAMRPKRFAAEWLPDNSGYIIREGNRKQRAYDVRTGEPLKDKPASEPERRKSSRAMASPDGKWRMEVDDGRLFVHDLTSGQRTQVSEPPAERNVSYNNFRWSPGGSHVAFVEADYTDVKTRAMLVPGDPSYPRVRERRFARVGGTIESLRLGIVDVGEKRLRWLPIDAPKQGFYFGEVEWAGDELLVEQRSRFRDRRVFYLAPLDGQPRKIYEEQDDAWVVASQGKNSGLIWLQDGESFIVITEKDGWRHAYLHSRDGKQRALLTPGEYDIIDRGAVDEDGGWLYFYASPEDATQKHLYRVPLDGTGKLEQISPAAQVGTHDYEFSPDAKAAFHTFSDFDTPPTIELVELDGHRVVKTLEDNRQLREQAEKIVHQPTEFFSLSIGEGIEVDAWMIKPQGFDPSKKYPVIVYVYGEPHSQTVLNRWGAAQSHFHRVLADLGYLIVSIDNRGTPAPKGAAWRRAIFGSLGPLSTDEQAAALKALGRARDYVDLSRVGIWGWSGGGSNTLNAMFRKPNDYHVGVAVVPKPQPHLYNAWFQEIFMRTREVNPQGYERAAPINFAEGLRGDLLIVTGSGETNTHIQIIEGLVDRLIKLGKRFDYMVYPNRDHGLSEGEGTVVHVRMLIARYFLEHLPPGAAKSGGGGS